MLWVPTPASTFPWIQLSTLALGAEPSLRWLMKYQSDPELVESSSQLYRVVALPPLRLIGTCLLENRDGTAFCFVRAGTLSIAER